MESKCQTSEMTFGSKYDAKGKKVSGWADWGDVCKYTPGLHFYSGADYSYADACNLTTKLGVLWGSKKFGFAT